MNPLLAGYLGVIMGGVMGFGLGVWRGQEIGWAVLPVVGLALWHWVAFFITRNHPFVIVDGD
jgi:hypothetical protein